MIIAFVRAQQLTLPPTHTVGGTRDYLEMQVNFQTSDWKDLSKWVHFIPEGGGEEWRLRLEDDKITKARRLNLRAGKYRVYVHGTATDGMRITTDLQPFEVIATGIGPGDDPLGTAPETPIEDLDRRVTRIEQQGVGPGPDGGQGGPSDAVRYGAPQDLSEKEKEQARKNIDAGSVADLSAQVQRAETAARTAESSQQAAAGNAQTATSAAETATGAASAAAGSAQSASTDADRAESAQSAANGSAVTAQQQAEAAAGSAQEATTQAENASGSATTAQQQANAAAGSAQTAETAAGDAERSATTATEQATVASQSAQTAQEQASAASTSAASAKDEADRAKREADRAEQAGSGTPAGGGLTTAYKTFVYESTTYAEVKEAMTQGYVAYVTSSSKIFNYLEDNNSYMVFWRPIFNGGVLQVDNFETAVLYADGHRSPINTVQFPPFASAANNDMVLTVVDGKPVWKTPSAGGGGPVDAYDVDAIVPTALDNGTVDPNVQSILDALADQPATVKVIPSSSTNAAILPNIYYKWGEMASLKFVLDTGMAVDGVVNEYAGEFVSGQTPTVFTPPADIVWTAPIDIKPNTAYQFSIVNGIGRLWFKGSDASGGGALQQLTFTGAVNETYDGTKPVTVEIPQGGSGSDISLGVTGASVGQIVEIEEVDESGKPKKWKAVNKPSGGSGEGFAPQVIFSRTIDSEGVKSVLEKFTPTDGVYQMLIKCPGKVTTKGAMWARLGANSPFVNYKLIGYSNAANNAYLMSNFVFYIKDRVLTMLSIKLNGGMREDFYSIYCFGKIPAIDNIHIDGIELPVNTTIELTKLA